MLTLALQEQLRALGITDFDEVAMRQELEKRVPTYTLIKLADWPARRWKCHYRLMMGSSMLDAQSVPEAYALALLVTSNDQKDKQQGSSPTIGPIS